VVYFSTDASGFFEFLSMLIQVTLKLYIKL